MHRLCRSLVGFGTRVPSPLLTAVAAAFLFVTVGMLLPHAPHKTSFGCHSRAHNVAPPMTKWFGGCLRHLLDRAGGEKRAGCNRGAHGRPALRCLIQETRALNGLTTRVQFRVSTQVHSRVLKSAKQEVGNRFCELPNKRGSAILWQDRPSADPSCGRIWARGSVGG